jgi:ABC-type multidrug transport system fused ATPase/permease subunit
LDTWIGERGTQISGGERQRLAVARAVLGAAPIWLLDEPTAHLDASNRAAISQMLLQLTQGKSLIWITHELNELASLDEILVMKDGRVVERGRADELTARGGWFARWRNNRV